VSVRKRSGKRGVAWVCDYRDGAGIRRSRQFATKAEATAFAAKSKIEIISGIHTPDAASITVAEAAQLWLARGRREGLEPATVLGYREHVDLHIVPFIGAMKLSRLSVPALTSFRDQLLDADRSPDMVRRVLTSLSGIVSTAQRRGLVTFNNVPRIERIRRTRSDRRPVMPTREELRAILVAADDLRDRVLVLLALLAGLRGSEIRGLTWANVDLKIGVLHVRQRADRWGHMGAPKSKASTRSIPIGAMLLNALKSWRLSCPLGALDLVFPATDGTVEQHIDLLRHVFWPIQMKAGVTIERGGVTVGKYALHALRHACAALWIEQGFNAKRIQTLMGHSSIAMTYDVYGYLLVADHEEERAGLDSLTARLVSDLK
jgi:integrase